MTDDFPDEPLPGEIVSQEEFLAAIEATKQFQPGTKPLVSADEYFALNAAVDVAYEGADFDHPEHEMMRDNAVRALQRIKEAYNY